MMPPKGGGGEGEVHNGTVGNVFILFLTHNNRKNKLENYRNSHHLTFTSHTIL